MRGTSKKFVYIGRKSCGCVMGIVTDGGNKSTAQAVAGFIIDGLVVNRVSWSEYRRIAEGPTFMNCPHGQLALFSSEEQ